MQSFLYQTIYGLKAHSPLQSLNGKNNKLSFYYSRWIHMCVVYLLEQEMMNRNVKSARCFYFQLNRTNEFSNIYIASARIAIYILSKTHIVVQMSLAYLVWIYFVHIKQTKITQINGRLKYSMNLIIILWFRLIL